EGLLIGFAQLAPKGINDGAFQSFFHHADSGVVGAGGGLCAVSFYFIRERAVIHHNLRGDAYAKASAYHAHNRFITANFSINRWGNAERIKPAIQSFAR